MAATEVPRTSVIAGIDIRDVGDCTCLRLRRVMRRITQIYEASLEPAHVTIGQFGVLATLYGAYASGVSGLAVGTLADRLGVDPTTLKRTLGPLQGGKLVEARIDADDRRVRLIAITQAGRETLAVAVPLWQSAQATLEKQLGEATKTALGTIADHAYNRIKGGPVSA